MVKQAAMAMMRTFASASLKHQRGVTLFELLIVLALISLSVVLAASGMRASSPRLAVTLATEQLEADLKRARVRAEATSTPVSVLLETSSYTIRELKIRKDLPRGVVLELEDGQSETITMGAGYWFNRHNIRLQKGSATSSIIIEPVTGRIKTQ